MYCENCGHNNDNNNKFCSRCGNKLDKMITSSQNSTSLSTGEKVAIFFGNLCLSPLLGIILYFVWKNEKPQKSQQACTLTIWTFVLWFVLVALIVVVNLAFFY